LGGAVAMVWRNRFRTLTSVGAGEAAGIVHADWTVLDTIRGGREMLSNDDRTVSEGNEDAAPGKVAKPGAGTVTPFLGNVRAAPRGAESRIGDDETHRRLQEARNRARHSTEEIVRRVLGPEWTRG
jgi:hypothetical protein